MTLVSFKKTRRPWFDSMFTDLLGTDRLMTEDLFLDELARSQRLERRAGKIEVGPGGDGQKLDLLGLLASSLYQAQCCFLPR